MNSSKEIDNVCFGTGNASSYNESDEVKDNSYRATNILHDPEQTKQDNEDNDDDYEDDDKNLKTFPNQQQQQQQKQEQQEQKNVSNKKKVFQLSLEKTKDFNEILRNRGVIYIARIPPRMTPTKMKTLLSDFGEVTRVYLQEEDPTVAKRRRMQDKYSKSNDGKSRSRSKRYVEGWVEMSCKKIAKHVARSLHMTSISNNKRSPHYGVLWNMKYLSKFQWSHLTEKVAYERRVREQKLRLETLQARRETANYKQLVETGKKLDKIEERRLQRAKQSSQQQQQRSDDHLERNDLGCTTSSAEKKTKTVFAVKRQLQPMDDTVWEPMKRPLLDALMK